MKNGVSSRGAVRVREAYTGPPDTGSTVRAYEPFRPPGTGTSTSCVVPPLIVYVRDPGVPPSLPADAVTFTRAVSCGAVRERVVPSARLSEEVARAPIGLVAG